jgi:predicted ABC-type ATPase
MMRQLYLPLADFAFIYDNSDHGGTLIAERRGAAPLTVHDSDRWKRIEEATR